MSQTAVTPVTEKDYNFRPVLKRLSPNQGAEILRYGWRRPDILSLGQGEGDAATPDFIAEAANKALKDGKTFYGPALGINELRQEISNYYSNIYRLNIPTGRIFATGSGTTAMHIALTSLLDEGDKVVAVTPIWKNLLGAIELAEAKTVQVPLDETPDGWKLDLDRLFDACTARTKLILIITPSNPTGWVMSREEIGRVLEFARSRGLWIVADEVYGRIVYDGLHAPSFLEQAAPDDLLYVVNSFSKSWAMTGWRLGWLVGPAAAESTVRDIALYDNLGPATFIQHAAIAALRHGEPFIRQQLDLWRGNRDYTMERFARTGRIVMPEPEATFYGFFRVEGEEDSMAFARKLIDEAALSLAPGCAFGKCCGSYMRMCFAVSRARLDDALTRLESVL